MTADGNIYVWHILTTCYWILKLNGIEGAILILSQGSILYQRAHAHRLLVDCETKWNKAGMFIDGVLFRLSFGTKLATQQHVRLVRPAPWAQIILALIFTYNFTVLD